MKNETFKKRFREADILEIPELLDILEQHSDKIQSYQKGTYKTLKNEFFNQPNAFQLESWKAKFLVFMGGFDFEIVMENTINNPQNIKTNDKMETTEKTLYIIFADLKGYGANAGNNPLLVKVTDFFFSLKAKYFADEKEHFFKPLGDGILATGHSLVDMAQKAILLRNEIKNHAWKQNGFPDNLNVRMALHTGEAYEHYKDDGTISEVSGTAIIQAARLEPYTMVGEIFCSQIYAGLLAQNTTHNLATINLGKYNLGKEHDKFELDIAVLFSESDKNIYERMLADDCKKHIVEKTQSHEVEQTKVANHYENNEKNKNNISKNNKNMDNKQLTNLLDKCFNNDDDLMLFCFNYFPKVHTNLSTTMPKMTKIIKLIEYCKQHDKQNELLANIKEERPEMYDKLVDKIEQDTPKTKNNNIMDNKNDNVTSINEAEKKRLKYLFETDANNFFSEIEELVKNNGEQLNSFLLKKSRLKRLKNDQRDELITRQEYISEFARLEKSLYEIIDSL